MEMHLVTSPISKDKLNEWVKEGFGDMAKATVDVKQEVMVLSGDLHADQEELLVHEHNSERAHTWGVNIYPEEDGFEVEFDSMVNIKPQYGNRSRFVEDKHIRDDILAVIYKLII